MPAAEPSGSLEKALEILFHLHAEAGAAGVTEIGRALDMPKSSVHRVLAALARRSLVERDERGRYRPGIGLVALGLGALDREPVLAAARPVLEDEAAAVGETVFLVAARAGRLLVLDKAEGTGFLRAAPRVGEAVPVHATAVGKLYLAFAEGAVPAERDGFERFTRHTLTRPADLEPAVARARDAGFAVSREEWIPGLAVVAAPVLARGRMQGAVALASSAQRYEELGGDALARRMVEAGERIGARLADGGSC